MEHEQLQPPHSADGSMPTVPGVEPQGEAEGPTFGSVAESISSGFENAESAMDFVKNEHLSSGVSTFAGVNSGLLSMVASAGDGFEAANDFKKGETAKGVADTTKAGAGAVGGVANMFHAMVEGYGKIGATDKELFEHRAGTLGAIGNAASGVGHGLDAATDLYHGADKYLHSKKVGDKADGALTFAKGGAEAGNAAAEGIMAATRTSALGLTENAMPLLTEGGLGLARVAGPAAGALVTGLQIGHYGDEKAKELGMYHDRHGDAESASDWAAEQGVAADEWVSEHLHSKALGTVAGLATTGIDSIRGAEGAVAAAATGAADTVGHYAHKLWDWL